MKNIFLILLILLFACKPQTEKSNIESNKINVIYILADDLGFGDVGIYGQKRIKTPRLDKMAAEGIRFTNHYSGNTVCAPSRCSLMTGLHQGHACIRGNRNNVLEDDDYTIAELFKDAGYKTGMIGKWGLGEAGSTGDPLKQGFDYYFGYLNQILAHNYYPDHLIRNGERIPLSNEVVIQTEGYAKGIGQAATVKKEYSHDLFVDDALRFIEESKNEPFFLYLPFTIPHANNEGKLTAPHGMEVPDMGIYADKDWPEVEKCKAAMITLLDTDVGRILDYLEEAGIAENTLVIFTSDNGPHKEGDVDPGFFESNGPLKGIKRDLYEGGIRVPFIAWWPGKITPGTSSDLLSAFWDMLPTFAELTGMELSQETDGISFMSTLLGKEGKQQVHDYLYWEFTEGQRKAQAVRSGKWKLLHNFSTESWELYDLESDIGEENNIISANREIAERLKGYMNEAHVYDEDYKLPGE